MTHGLSDDSKELRRHLLSHNGSDVVRRMPESGLQFRARTTERQVAQFVDDQKIKFVQPFQHAIQRELLLRFFQLIDQRRSREELRS